MRLLLRSYNSDSEHDDFGRYAIVNIDDESIKLIAARRKIFLTAKAQDKSLYEMYFWDGHADFYGASFGRTEDFDDDGIEESFDRVLNEKEWTEIDADFDTEGEETHPTSPDRTDCDQMVIGEDGVRWYAACHYGDTNTMTACLPYMHLFEDKL